MNFKRFNITKVTFKVTQKSLIILNRIHMIFIGLPLSQCLYCAVLFTKMKGGHVIPTSFARIYRREVYTRLAKSVNER